MQLSLVWDLKAFQQFEEAISFIENDSFVNAEKFKIELLKKLNELLSHPERYPRDKYKIKNDGAFKAFEMFKYRISYQLYSNEIRVIRIRHTKKSPLMY